MGKEFKIQVPQYIVRNEGIKISDKSFVLLAKLIQVYYSQKGEKKLTFDFNHKLIMFYVCMSDNRTIKECLKELYDIGLLEEEVKTLPRKENLTVSLSAKVIPELINKGKKDEEKELFTQLESDILHRIIIEKINYSGVRLLYYIKSFMNYKKVNKNYAYPSILRMSNELHTTEKTIIKYINTLEKVKFIKVRRNDVSIDSDSYVNDKEVYTLQRMNNQYFINHDKIKKYLENKNILTAEQ